MKKRTLVRVCVLLAVLAVAAKTNGVASGFSPLSQSAVADIERQLEKCRELIRDGQKYDEALALLTPLSAKVFGIEDKTKQLELAIDIFLLRGIALAGTGDKAGALREFQSMFALSPDMAKAATKNIYDASLIALLREAENRPQTAPAPSAEPPAVPPEKPTGAPMSVRSRPAGARILIDGADSGQVTDGQIAGLSLGPHAIKLVKEFYADWEMKIQLQARVSIPPVEARLIAVSYSSAGTWGGPGDKRFSTLSGMTIDRRNRIVVLNGEDPKLFLINSGGESQALAGTNAADQPEILRPSGLAMDGSGTIYISDADAHAIFVLNPDGRLAARWGGLGKANTEFNTPLGLAVDARNDVYIADLGNNRVKKFNGRGEFVRAFGASGAPNESLVSPRAVALAPNGDVYALDSVRVAKYSAGGAFLGSFGKEGSGDGEFDHPMGMSLDADGCIYVADTGNHRVQKFDPQGRYLCGWGGRGRDPGLMDSPCAVVVDAAGVVYVAEQGNHRIQLFTVGSGALGAAR